MGVTFEKTGRLVTITWDRPPLNVLDLSLLRELDHVLAVCAADPGVDVVVFEGRANERFPPAWTFGIIPQKKFPRCSTSSTGSFASSWLCPR